MGSKRFVIEVGVTEAAESPDLCSDHEASLKTSDKVSTRLAVFETFVTML